MPHTSTLDPIYDTNSDLKVMLAAIEILYKELNDTIGLLLQQFVRVTLSKRSMLLCKIKILPSQVQISCCINQWALLS